MNVVVIAMYSDTGQMMGHMTCVACPSILAPWLMRIMNIMFASANSVANENELKAQAGSGQGHF